MNNKLCTHPDGCQNEEPRSCLIDGCADKDALLKEAVSIISDYRVVFAGLDAIGKRADKFINKIKLNGKEDRKDENTFQ